MSAARPVTVPDSPSPSVASISSAAVGESPAKKVKRDAKAPIYSQPENTGVGVSIGTNMVYAVDYLKQQSARPMTLERVLNHLNLNKEPEAFQRELVERLRMHPRVRWIPDAALKEQAWNTGTYEHNPIIPNVRDKPALVKYLQRRTDAQGVAVKDLKDGWPDCEAPITELERDHRLLVVRTKKDNHAKMVWLDDASLHHSIDAEFQAMWHKVDVPGQDDIARRLAAVGQKPTSEDPRAKLAAAPREKKQKKRAQRRTGKATNTHMEHLLKDYTHYKR